MCLLDWAVSYDVYKCLHISNFQSVEDLKFPHTLIKASMYKNTYTLTHTNFYENELHPRNLFKYTEIYVKLHLLAYLSASKL